MALYSFKGRSISSLSTQMSFIIRRTIRNKIRYAKEAKIYAREAKRHAKTEAASIRIDAKIAKADEIRANRDAITARRHAKTEAARIRVNTKIAKVDEMRANRDAVTARRLSKENQKPAGHQDTIGRLLLCYKPTCP